MTACRPRCGACCIAPSITTPMPGMPNGKPAGAACLHLTAEFRCALFGQPDRPDFCAGLQPSPAMCRDSRDQALAGLDEMELATRP